MPPRRPNRVAIVGVGYSTVGRATGLSTDELTIQAGRAALDDAGMSAADIDGISTMGGDALRDAWTLGMEPLNWFSTTHAAGPAFAYAALQSIAAIASGFCDTCITFRIIHRQPPSAARLAPRPAAIPRGVGGDYQFLAPFGAGSPTQWAGLLTQRHMAQYGTTEEQFGAHVIAQRDHAAMNEDAFFRDPLTMEEYLAARYVSKPLRILDCDYPCDAGSAVIFTTEERAHDFQKKPVFVESYALTAIRDLNFEILDDMTSNSPTHCAKEIWAKTDLRPGDVDCAQLYDGFTIITFQWLEALGFCKSGESGPFIAEGNTRLGGKLPVNTDGGACNVGRRHGANFCIEATRQLRGECGGRQVKDAKVSVFSNGVGPFCGAALLTAD